MTAVAPAAPSVDRRAARASFRRVRHGPVRRPAESETRGPLACYADLRGRAREIVAERGRAGTLLVVDRDAGSGGDGRLLAHLAADEPARNAMLICEDYLPRVRRDGCRVRPLTAGDYRALPFPEGWEADTEAPPGRAPADMLGHGYRLDRVDTGMSILELRWRRHPPAGESGSPHVVSVREAVAALQDYEPVRSVSRAALVRWHGDRGVSTAALQAELERVLESPILLNRRLRETVLATIEREGLSMSEIAIRCGRVKHDGAGNVSGETSWLARRLGILPEGGRRAPTPWVHSDVLALIARRGLGICPREVELG